MKRLILDGEVYAITAAFLWGINYPWVKVVLWSIPESEFMLIRFTASVILLTGYLWMSGEGIGINREHSGCVLLLGMVGVGFYNILWTCGIHRTTAANAALLISTSPIFTAVYSMVTKQEKTSLGTWVGTILAFSGIYLIISRTPGAEFNLDFSVFTGNMLVLSGSLLFALYGIVAKPLLEHYSPVKLTTLAMTGGFPVIVLYSLSQDIGVSLSTINLSTWAGLCFIVLFGTIVAFVFWYKGIKQTSPVRTVVFHFIVPVISTVIGALALDEQISAGQIAGAILVFAGLIIVKVKFRDCAESGEIRKKK